MLRPHAGVELQLLSGPCMTLAVGPDRLTLDAGEDRFGEALLEAVGDHQARASSVTGAGSNPLQKTLSLLREPRQ